MNASEKRKAAKSFINRWKNRGKERQDSQSFWLDLLQNVYGIENPSEYIVFEDSVTNMMDGTSFLDGYIEKTHVLIEQKSKDKGLNKGIRQSDGTFLTPFQQAQRYSANLPYSKRPRWIITSNFKEFYIYDMERPNSEPSIIKLNDLEKDYYRLEILIDKTNTQIEKQTQVSIKAGELIGEIYDELLEQYREPNKPETLESINQLSVRLVFCFYAEDAGLFGEKGMFHDYLSEYSTQHIRTGLIELFKILNTKIEDRDPYLHDKLARFPYVNGGLFEYTNIEIPQFTFRLRELILENASSGFDWSEISPTVFGGVFESTLNPEERHSGGMHYTSIENIHKVIDPLLVDELKEELNKIKQLKQPAAIRRRARKFQSQLSNLTFLDPAAGSGNFLTETYITLRELENEALVLIHGEEPTLDTETDLIKVTLDQFYGIEINDFAVSVAKTALWIAESQMFEKTKDLIFAEIDYLPIESQANIVLGNALRMNWNDVVNKNHLNYIVGNPPFIGHQWQTENQKKDMKIAFHDLNKYGKLDYVASWYNKALDYIQNTRIKVAFVSTNSINQGESVPTLWKFLFEKDMEIQFAYRPFVWTSDAIDKASVHVVIIGFTSYFTNRKKVLYEDEMIRKVNNINGYLIPGKEIYLKSRGKPINEYQMEITKGSQPTDGGHLILSHEEYKAFISKYPDYAHLIKRYMGSREFINNIKRYCLWLSKDNHTDYASNSFVKSRLKLVVESRLKSKTKSVREAANTPYLFTQIRQPKSNYLAFPAMSSSNRRYIPIGFINKEIIASNQLYIVPTSSMFLFGLYTSNMHMAWMRLVAGRLKSDYRYAPFIYNNFPWPNITDKQKKKISKTGENILKVRELYPKSTLAQLYDRLTMPPELRKAHQENDKVVMEAYGLEVGPTTEADAVMKLFEMYELLKNKA